MDFNVLCDWDSFEDIAKLLYTYFHAEMKERVDGAESKFLILDFAGYELTLVNNPYGNSLKASSQESKNILMEIYNNWSKYSYL